MQPLLKNRIPLVSIALALASLVAGCVSNTEIKQVAAAKPIEMNTAQKKKPIMFKRIVVKIKHGDEIGTVHEGLLNIAKSKLYWRKGGYLNFSDDDFNERFREVLEAANYEVVGNPDSLFEDPTQWQAELLVAGLVKELNVNSYFPNGGLGDFTKSRGTAYLKVNWQIYSRAEHKVVLELATEGSVDQKKTSRHGADEALADAFAMAVNNLLAEKQFHDLDLSPDQAKR